MASKMLSTGGPESGLMWDDGAHDNVKTIQISHDVYGINFVKFEYLDGTKTVTGEQYSHGKISFHPGHTTEEFELESDEYLTEVEAYVQHIENDDIGSVMMFKFKTNKRTTEAYGHQQTGSSLKMIVLGEKNKKIVGFHGNTGERFLHTIGVYVSE